MPVDLSDDLLLAVQRPARYAGGEINTTPKDHRAVRASIALAYPDVYDIGMDYQGFHILYPMVNAHPGFAAERVFCPWPDMAAQLRRRGVPLHGLETRTPLRDFTLLGFTLQYELSYTNILEMLDLAQIPLLAAERRDVFPVILAGGPGALQPEPLAPFIDAFVIGEAEEVLMRLLAIAARHREAGTRDREAVLLEMAQVPGVYVPRFYAPDASGSVIPLRRDVPFPIRRQIFDITQETWSVRPVVPLMRTVNDRFMLEIKRGCTRGCRFCQAGMITRPMRERTPGQIIELTGEGLANTGHKEVSLMSLSSADYSALAPLMREINARHERDHVSIALSSIRVNAFDVQFADEIKRVKKTGFTFAPEAGTERLRSVINKELSDERFLNVVAHVFARGWQRLKFYFMCSLPTETDEDLRGIIDITERSVAIGRRFWGGNFEIAVSVSPFIAKAHTPFQWEGLLPREEITRRWRLVADGLRGRNVRVRPHSPDQAWVEGVLARGGRETGRAMLRAWRAGARFDSWDEHFRLDLWQRALAEEGIDTDDIVHARWAHDRSLPWDHIEAALGKHFLVKEHERALAKALTPDCAFSHCVGCDSCDFDQVKNVIVLDKPLNTYESLGEAPPPPETLRRSEPPPQEPDPVLRLRVRLTKSGAAKYLSHLDYVKTVHQILFRAAVPVAWTSGFSPKPRVMFTPPLPLGYTSLAEGADLLMAEEGDIEDWLARLRDASIPGVEWHFGGTGGVRDANVANEVTHADYTVRVANPSATLGLSPPELAARAAEFLALDACDVVEEGHRQRPKRLRSGKLKTQSRTKTKDFRALAQSVAIETISSTEVLVTMRLACGGQGALDPLRLLAQLTGREVRLGDAVQAERTALWRLEGGASRSLFADALLGVG